MRFFLLFLALPLCGFSQDNINQLLDDLETIRYVNEVVERPLPLTFSFTESGGYFVTPSARMSCAGEIGGSFVYAPPYELYNARIQPFWFAELTANWRIFQRVEDSVLSKEGFGNFADRGANIKFALMTPEQTHNQFPGVAFGFEDFMGSKRFSNFFGVVTQVFQPLGLEATLGWGTGRYSGSSKGFFGGFAYFPFFHSPYRLLQGVSLVAEYDPVNYKKDPHPFGKESNCPINFGIKYNYADLFGGSLSCIRGKEFAASANVQCNLGSFQGILPKVKNPPLYRPEVGQSTYSVERIAEALASQGFRLRAAWLLDNGDSLTLSIINCIWRQEREMRQHLDYVLQATLLPGVDRVTVIIESFGVPCQQYGFTQELLDRIVTRQIAPIEFHLLTSREDAVPVRLPPTYLRHYEHWGWFPTPRFETFFGGAKGKFKCDVGPGVSFWGQLPWGLYYEAGFNYSLFSTLHGLLDFDRYNPSHILNVATDYVRYRQEGIFSTERAYLQHCYNYGNGFFGRAALGYFQVNYAGLAAEALWYPARSMVALGIEGALLKKRSYHGLGFQSKIRQDFSFRSYSILSQCFLNLYLDMPQACLFAKISAGQFLARDWGARFELTRYFKNGLRITGWLTATNAYDIMHGERYFDRGIAFEIPLDLFFAKSSRRMWNYGLAAWLRDAGYRSSTGVPLFDIVNRERRF